MRRTRSALTITPECTGESVPPATAYWGGRRRIICFEQRQSRFPCIHTIEEILAPQFARRHIYQLFDVDGRYPRLFRALRASVFAFHTGAFPVLDDQRLDPLVGQNHATMGFVETR